MVGSVGTVVEKGQRGAHVWHAVAIDVVVAGVADAIAIEVGLVAVGNAWAIVGGVGNAVVVAVAGGPGGSHRILWVTVVNRGFTCVSLAVVVGVGLRVVGN